MRIFTTFLMMAISLSAQASTTADQIGLYYLLVGAGAHIEFPGMSKRIVEVKNVHCESSPKGRSCTFVDNTEEAKGRVRRLTLSASYLLWNSLKRIGENLVAETCRGENCVRSVKLIHCNMVADSESVPPDELTYCRID